MTKKKNTAAQRWADRKKLAKDSEKSFGLDDDLDFGDGVVEPAREEKLPGVDNLWSQTKTGKLLRKHGDFSYLISIAKKKVSFVVMKTRSDGGQWQVVKSFPSLDAAKSGVEAEILLTQTSFKKI